MGGCLVPISAAWRSILLSEGELDSQSKTIVIDTNHSHFIRHTQTRKLTGLQRRLLQPRRYSQGYRMVLR